MNWHFLSVEEVARQLRTDPKGIGREERSVRIARYGRNKIEQKKKKTALKMLLHQFTDFMIMVLIAAAIISGIIGDITDTIIIIAIILINALVGFIQEYRADKAMEALRRIASQNAKVIQEGKPAGIETELLVQGDVVILETGNIIPADVRFFETHQLKADESALTGESHNVEKNSSPLEQKEYPLGDMLNMGFKGTFITNGRALAYVVATGMDTELGRIAKMIQTEETATPLQVRLAAFGKSLSVAIIIICAIIFFIGWLRGEELLTMLLTAISLAVAAIPEALPAMVTIALAFGAGRLVKSKALIRKLPAVETLGSVTYICSDKTGTLTLNKMSVQQIFEPNEKNNKLFFGSDRPLLFAMALNNDVSKDEKGILLGDSTEIALVQFADENKINHEECGSKYSRIAEIPFDSNRKCMSTLHKIPGRQENSGGVVVITKGAIETILSKLDYSEKISIKEIERKADEMAARGYRVLAFAGKIIKELPGKFESEEIESSLTFFGLAGLIDPPREEVKESVRQCKDAGIIPVMITGDHKLTARAIARQLGIISSTDEIVMDGTELSRLSLHDFSNIVEKVRVYARVNPEQKLKIVKALKEKGQFVAMTGDGVNDAPALKNSDIGIAMGINGSEVAKEASHMILMDDNFSTIIVAVRHGRRIFDNILKFIKYTMTSNSGEIWAIFLAPFFLLPVPLLAVHILWINLVTDGLPGLALASEPAEPNIMKRPPRDPRQNIFRGKLVSHILWVGLLMGLVTIAMQSLALHYEIGNWQTMTFTVLCFSQLGHVMAIRSEKESIFRIGVFANKQLLLALGITVALQLAVIYIPFFNPVFRTQPLSSFELAVTIALSTLVFWAVELEKWIKRRWDS